MSAGATGAGASAAASGAGANPWLIAVLVALATFMEVLDTTIANVALPYIAGGMGVSEDEASWVVTTYLVANAVALTASSFLAQAVRPQDLLPGLPRAVHRELGALRLCLESAVAAAVPHPAGSRRRRHGAGLAIDPGRFLPAGEARPGLRVVRGRRRGRPRGRADARRLAVRQLFLAVVLSDQRPGRPHRDRADRADLARARSRNRGAQAAEAAGRRFDLVGFVLVATFLGALELVLDRGLEDDWFGSTFIVAATAVCALAFVLDDPVGDQPPQSDDRPPNAGDAPVGACFLVMLATGAILLGTTQFLPQLVQQNFGYTATWAGLVLSPGGVVTMVMMFVVRPSGRAKFSRNT